MVGNTVVLEEVAPKVPLPEGQSVTVYIDEDGWELDEADTRELSRRWRSAIGARR